jgi:hypothetical protein
MPPEARILQHALRPGRDRQGWRCRTGRAPALHLSTNAVENFADAADTLWDYSRSLWIPTIRSADSTRAGTARYLLGPRGDALNLQTCADCRARLDVLQVTRSAFMETEAVDDATIARISALVGAEAQSERAGSERARRWASAFEALLAGIAGPIVLISSDVEIGSAAAGVLTFALGAAFLVYGRRLRLYAA